MFSIWNECIHYYLANLREQVNAKIIYDLSLKQLQDFRFATNFLSI